MVSEGRAHGGSANRTAGTAEWSHLDPEGGNRERETENGVSLLTPPSTSLVAHLLQQGSIF